VSIARIPSGSRPLEVARRRVVEVAEPPRRLVNQLGDTRKLRKFDLRHLIGVRVVVLVKKITGMPFAA
jgi:hypothetical protein